MVTKTAAIPARDAGNTTDHRGNVVDKCFCVHSNFVGVCGPVVIPDSALRFTHMDGSVAYVWTEEE